MTTEYAIQEKTLLDGDFDRLRTGHGPFDSIPYTREEAEELVERQNKRYDTVWMRVVKREVTDWTVVHPNLDPEPWLHSCLVIGCPAEGQRSAERQVIADKLIPREGYEQDEDKY